MRTKVCFKCLVEKPISDYYTHPRMLDGHLNKCKSCTKSDTKSRANALSGDPKWMEQEKDRHREKYHRLGYKDKHKPNSSDKKRINKKYGEKFPEKVRCRRSIGALRKKMGVKKHQEVHHWNYNVGFELDVIILDRKDHYFLHRFIEYDQSAMMYRSKNGELLDTKEKHFNYFKSLEN